MEKCMPENNNISLKIRFLVYYFLISKDASSFSYEYIRGFFE